MKPLNNTSSDAQKGQAHEYGTLPATKKIADEAALAKCKCGPKDAVGKSSKRKRTTHKHKLSQL